MKFKKGDLWEYAPGSTYRVMFIILDPHMVAVGRNHRQRCSIFQYALSATLGETVRIGSFEIGSPWDKTSRKI